MADKPPKPSGVLGSPPARRPERIGRPRRAKVAATPAAAPRRAAKRATSRRAPAAVVPACPSLRAAKPAAPPPRRIAAPTGTELVTTTLRAAAELAHIGVSVGGRMLKRTLHRFP
jgi:hypothetical protein